MTKAGAAFVTPFVLYSHLFGPVLELFIHHFTPLSLGEGARG